MQPNTALKCKRILNESACDSLKLPKDCTVHSRSHCTTSLEKLPNLAPLFLYYYHLAFHPPHFWERRKQTIQILEINNRRAPHQLSGSSQVLLGKRRKRDLGFGLTGSGLWFNKVNCSYLDLACLGIAGSNYQEGDSSEVH
jgi:hypothetical protein